MCCLLLVTGNHTSDDKPSYDRRYARQSLAKNPTHPSNYRFVVLGVAPTQVSHI